MRLLYMLSSCSKFVVFNIFSYRQGVIYQNISRSFPYKNYKEVKEIAKKFHLHFIDNFFELLKTVSMSSKNLDKKVSFVNFHIAEKHIQEGKNVIACLGHVGNWDMLNVLSTHFPYDVCGAYKPVRSKILDKLMLYMRSRYGATLIPSKSIVKHILSRKENKAFYVFLADQCPKEPDEKYQLTFLNQRTSNLPGVEKLARATNSAVVYIHITEPERGVYRMECVPMFTDSKNTEELEITRLYSQLLEKNILEQPYSWLWSHKRWKR